MHRLLLRLIALTICILSQTSSLWAQSLNFATPLHDFGTIREDGGVVSCRFEFRNDSQEAVVIYNIRTSCGCTTTKYSRQPIAAGASSGVELTFDPRFRPGTFAKDIYIYSSASQEPIVLGIKGRVTPRTATIEERYPYKLGEGVRIGALYLTIALGDKDELSQTSVDYTNNSDRGVEVRFEPLSKSNDLRLYYDEALAAGEHTRLVVGYNPREGEGDEGVLRDSVNIYINGVRANYVLYIVGKRFK